MVFVFQLTATVASIAVALAAAKWLLNGFFHLAFGDTSLGRR